MSNSLILRASARYLMLTCVLLSLFILLRGHNEPGGGFIGGLIGALGVATYAMAHGRSRTLALLRIDPKAWTGLGLLLALASGLIALALHAEPFLEHQWTDLELGPLVLPLGTTLLFDVGVYLTVMGFALAFLLPFLEE